MTNIETGIPIPPHKYPWKSMKAGQSFTVRTAQERDNALRTARGQSIKATSRKVKRGYRLWRTS